jgi:hypothetical protein
MFLRSRALQVRKVDNLTVICEPVVYKTRDPHNPIGFYGLLKG